MIKKIALILLMSLFIYQTTPNQQEKKYPVSLTLNQWGIVLKGTGKLTIEEGGAAYQDIISQLQPQLAQDTIKKK